MVEVLNLLNQLSLRYKAALAPLLQQLLPLLVGRVHSLLGGWGATFRRGEGAEGLCPFAGAILQAC